jgi:hypothetical protein
LRRRGGVRFRDLEAIAPRLGRTRRGKESSSHGQWISRFQVLRPVTIARHRGDLKTGTKSVIIKALEQDIELWEIELSERK